MDVECISKFKLCKIKFHMLVITLTQLKNTPPKSGSYPTLEV